MDHGAKPAVASGQREPWLSFMRPLATLPNVHCKNCQACGQRLARSQIWRSLGVALPLISSRWPICSARCASSGEAIGQLY
nr:amidohydrolase [Candidatus Burkholderia verschuerenii]